MTLPIQHTIRYKTYLKTALVEALGSAFAQHPDSILRDTKVRLDYSFEEVDYPTVIVRYFERDFQNAGVGHVEWTKDEDGVMYKFYRRLYHGDIEFAIYALSSLDRDLISDSLVQILAMPDLLAWTNLFALRLYDPVRWAELTGVPEAELQGAHVYHFTTLNTDSISGFGEAQSPAPWSPEDVLLYTTTHRAPVFGEVLSFPPDTAWTTIQNIFIYPYLPTDPVPTGVPDTALWTPDPGTPPIEEWQKD